MDDRASSTDQAVELTAGWLAEHAGLHGRRIVGTEPLGEDRGFSGRITRLRLEPGAPASVVLKRPSADPAVARMMADYGLLAREALFYERLAGAECPVRVPSRIGAGPGGDGPVLVLEDLSHAVPGDSDLGMTLRDAEPIARAIASLHARWWGADDLLAEIPSLDAGPPVADLVARCWPGFAVRFGARLPAVLVEAGATVGPVLAAARSHLGAGETTLLHGDLRLDNLMFAPDGGPIFLDWQTLCRGRGVFDLAYLSAGSLVRHPRGEIDALVAAWHGALAEAGVTGYGLDACRRDYRIAVVFLYARTVIAGASLAFAEGPAHARFSVALDRWIELAAETGALAALQAGTLDGL